MTRPSGSAGLLTLEPLVDAVRDGVEEGGWTLCGLQKTTSHEFQGRWAGESTRSAYLFFHRSDLPECVSLEAYLDETSAGLRGNLGLVVDGPEMARLGPLGCVLDRVLSARVETLPRGYRSPVSLRVGVPSGEVSAGGADVQLRVKLALPRAAIDSGALAVSSLCVMAVSSFETLLERPEVAELLPPVVD